MRKPFLPTTCPRLLLESAFAYQQLTSFLKVRHALARLTRKRALSVFGGVDDSLEGSVRILMRCPDGWTATADGMYRVDIFSWLIRLMCGSAALRSWEVRSANRLHWRLR